ncbi:MAG: MerR family transcriptional regulator [Deltaproteobacteria bacterium]|nr:MAG: MerR family transcriptional regulator [Deltaproteobacteria bacterium]
MPEDKQPRLPDKIYFKIGEVAEIVGVEPYVLRYWESEFPALRPVKSKSQQRMYRKKDVELLLRIKKLLYEDKYTIAGAKKQLARGGDKNNGQMSLRLPDGGQKDLLKKVERELEAMMKLLE